MPCISCGWVINILGLITTYLTHLGKNPSLSASQLHAFHTEAKTSVESLARAIAVNLTNKWVGIVRDGKETVLHVAAVTHEV